MIIIVFFLLRVPVMRTPANTMPPVNLDIQTKIIAVFVFLDSTVKTVKEVGA